MSSLVVFVLSTLAMAAPLILAAIGGFTSERAGVINIALEGMMLASACITAVASVGLHSAWLGVGCGVASAVVMSLLHWLVTQHYQVDHIISGMVVNLIALGGTNFLYQRFQSDTPAEGIPTLPSVTLDLPSGAKLEITPFLVLAYLLPFLVAIYVRRTRGGLRLLAVGSDPDKARLMGVQPLRVRLLGLLATGIFTGLAGALIVGNAARFTDNMTAGRGYIALAALIVGGWRPIPSMVACLLFGAFDALQLQLQGTNLFGSSIPSEAWSSLPYLATVIALAGFLGKSRPPLGLGKP